MLTIQQAEGTVQRFLNSKKVPRLTPLVRQLAEALPIVAEQWRVLQSPELATLTSTIVEQLWPTAIQHQEWEEETAWPLLGTSCVLAAELLGIELAGIQTDDWRWKRKLDDAQTILRRPRVLVLLRDAPPVRVLLAECPPGMDPVPSQDEWAAQCEALLERLLGPVRVVRLALSTHAEGSSQLAGLLVRALAERVRERAPAHPWLKLVIGVTGELDVQGVVRPVLACVEKVRSFFKNYSDGVCLIPKANWPELDELRPRDSKDDPFGARQEQGRLTASQWQRLYPISSASELLIRFGLISEKAPATGLFSMVREQAAFVSDWRGQRYRTEQLVELKLREPHSPRKRVGVPSLFSDDWSVERIARFLGGRRDSTDQRPVVIISGGAGSGKSMVLQRLLHDLNGGEQQLDGPAVLFRVREMREGDTWFSALGRKLDLSAQQVAAALGDPTIARRTVLLLDGLDEAPPPLRRRLLVEAQAWPGPLLLASRQLREAEQWPALRLVIQNLGSSERRELLELSGRADLADTLGSVHDSLWDLDGPVQARWASRSEQSPAGRTVADLASTPLGLSLLATLLKPGTASIDSRVQLLREGISHLLDRAEAEGKVTETERRLFDGRGTRYLGAAAWKMLSEGRAILSDADLVWASQQVQLSSDIEVQLGRVLDSSGFLQRRGPEEREFSHKSFAEYCAATFLQTDPARLSESWNQIGDPGIDEVLLHLSALTDPTPLLSKLLHNNERPLSALALATRMLVECVRDPHPKGKQISLVVEILKRRIRILGRFPNWELPAELGYPGFLWQALRKWSDVLRASVLELVAACPKEVNEWLSDPPRPRRQTKVSSHYMDHGEWPHEPSSAKAISSKLAEQLHAALRFDIPLRALLRMKHGAEALKSWPRAALIEQLPALCDDPDAIIREAALDAEVEVAPLNSLIPRIGSPSLVSSVQGQSGKRRELMFSRLLREGSPLQKKEALLDFGIAAAKIDYYEPRDDETPHRTAQLGNTKYHLPSASLRKPPQTAEDTDTLWRLSWRTGLLGEKSDDLLEELYAAFLHDNVAEARQRAIGALRHLWDASERSSRPVTDSSERAGRLPKRFWPRTHAEVRALLADPALGVRVEAAKYVSHTKIPFLLEELLPLWLSSEARARLIGMAMALDAGTTIQLDILLETLSEDPSNWAGDSASRWRLPSKPGEETPLPPAATRSEARITSVARDARQRIIARLSQDATVQLRRRLADLLDEAKYSSVARELLDADSSQDKKISNSELRRLVDCAEKEKHPIARRWATQRLAHRSSDSGTIELLRQLARDSDHEVAKEAGEAVKRHDEHAAWMLEQEQRRTQPARAVAVPVRELTYGAVRGFDSGANFRSGDGQAQAEPFRLTSLPTYTSFEALWSALSSHPLELENWASVDYEGRDDRDDHIALLAEKAWIENRQKTTQVVDRLRELYLPQHHRILCIRDLDHPLVGLWAEILLATTARERDMLALVYRSPKCAARVANISRGTDLAPAVVDAFIDAATRGVLGMDPPRESKVSYGNRDDTPTWLHPFAQLGGLEGLVRLVQTGVSPDVRKVALIHIGANQAKLTTNLSEGARTQVIGWARETVAQGDDADRVLALYLLALIGNRDDAAAWVQHLRVEVPPVRVSQAALRLIRIHGSPEQAPGLRTLLQTVDAELLGSVVGALAAHGDQADVETFFVLLKGERQRADRWDINWSREKWHWEELARSVRSAALEGIVRHGDTRAAHRLIKLLLKATNASAAAEQHELWREYDVDSEEESTVRPLRPIRVGQRDSTSGLAGMEDTALMVAAEFGRLPMHALLIVGALLRDPGDEEYGVNTEGYDEMMVNESQVPKQAASALKAILERTDREAVRQSFLRCALWGGPSASIARAQLDKLGGPQRRDLPRILNYLARRPTNRQALSLLSSVGAGERELAEIWSKGQIV